MVNVVKDISNQLIDHNQYNFFRIRLFLIFNAEVIILLLFYKTKKSMPGGKVNMDNLEMNLTKIKVYHKK